MRVRQILVLLHRYVGLVLAVPLVVAGLGGAVIAFQQEIDAALNPAFHRVADHGPALTPSALAARIEAQVPDAEVVFMPLDRQAGRPVRTYVQAREGAPPLAFDEVAADPATGAIVGKRLWGKASLAPEDIVSFIYRMHLSLALGDVGTWIMGVAAVIWLLDNFVALALTLPRRWPWWPRWAKAWRVKTSAGTHRTVFDVHRAGGLWPWLLLLIVACSSIQMNLPEQVFRPAVAWFAPLSPVPSPAVPPSEPTQEGLGWDEAVKKAKAEAIRLGWPSTSGWMQWDREGQTYRYCHCSLDPDSIDFGARRELRVDSRTADVTVLREPSRRTAADVFVDLQYPLHTGRWGGLAGRIVVCVIGLAVAALAISGVWLFVLRRRVQAEEATGRLPRGRGEPA